MDYRSNFWAKQLTKRAKVFSLEKELCALQNSPSSDAHSSFFSRAWRALHMFWAIQFTGAPRSDSVFY